MLIQRNGVKAPSLLAYGCRNWRNRAGASGPAPSAQASAHCELEVGNDSRRYTIENYGERPTPAVPDQCRESVRVTNRLPASRIGRDLREQYELPTKLPSNLLAVIRQLDAIEGNQLFREFYCGDSRYTADSSICTKDLLSASERSIAELDIPAPRCSAIAKKNSC
jgi:hypothetical protein